MQKQCASGMLCSRLCRTLWLARKLHQRGLVSTGEDEYGGGWDAGPHAVRIAVWWDFDDCDIPPGVPPRKVGINIVSALRMRGFKGPVSITAYGDTWQLSRGTQEALASTGIALHHLPSGRKNSQLDRTIMVDLVLWSLDHPPPAHLFVISTNEDLSIALHSLRMKNYNVLLACKSHSAPPSLLAAASSVWYWGKLVKGEGLVTQVSVDIQDNNRKPSYSFRSTTTTTCTAQSSLKSSPEVEYEAKEDLPATDPDIPMDSFHKDVCALLQRAAASIITRNEAKSSSSGSADAQEKPHEDEGQDKPKVKYFDEQVADENSKNAASSDEEKIPSVGGAENGTVSAEDDVEKSSSEAPVSVSSTSDDGKARSRRWTWRTLLFGRGPPDEEVAEGSSRGIKKEGNSDPNAAGESMNIKNDTRARTQGRKYFKRRRCNSSKT